MIKSLDKSQLAFLLDIKVEDARAKMCVAYCKANVIIMDAEWNDKNKIVDPYPVSMDIDLLASALNIPTLQEMVNDVHVNYLKRAGSKKWILFDYPQKKILLDSEKGLKPRLSIPKTLKSLLREDVVLEIEAYWAIHYPNYVI